jgi:hypothetical protein
MDGESAESDEAAMDVEPQPRAAKRGRRSQDQQQQDDGASPPTVRNGGGGGGGGGDGPGRVLRPRGAGPVGSSRR